VLRERGFVWPIPLQHLWGGMVGLLLASGTAGYLFAASVWDACESRYVGESAPGMTPERTDSTSIR